MISLFSVVVTILLHVSTLSASLLEERQTACDTYVVSGITGGFKQRVQVDFSTAQSGGDVAALLSSHGLSISDYTISGSPVPHTFSPGNLALGAGTLNMKVSAYPGSGSIQSAEFVTDDTFKYASVRTVQKSSSVPGIVEGNFFYLNDNEEIDFEILTSTISSPSACVPAGIWATNQALTPGGQSTHSTIPFTFDPRAGFHEYRIDWTSSATTFYIDGQQKARLTSNIPTQAGHWIWNTWSNGDPCWSNGPPQADSITQIRSIDILKGYTTTVSGRICNV